MNKLRRDRTKRSVVDTMESVVDTIIKVCYIAAFILVGIFLCLAVYGIVTNAPLILAPIVSASLETGMPRWIGIALGIIIVIMAYFLAFLVAMLIIIMFCMVYDSEGIGWF